MYLNQNLGHGLQRNLETDIVMFPGHRSTVGARMNVQNSKSPMAIGVTYDRYRTRDDAVVVSRNTAVVNNNNKQQQRSNKVSNINSR